MKKKEESQLINLFVVGVLMVIASFFYPMARPVRLMGVMAIVIGIVPFLYGALSEKKRHSRAKISEIDEMKGYEFERYIVFLLLNNGYQNVSDTGEGPDQGTGTRGAGASPGERDPEEGQRFFRCGGSRPPVPQMIAFIDDHRGVFGVGPICRVLGIAPSTF